MRIISLNLKSGDKKIEGAEEKSSALLLLKESIEFIEHPFFYKFDWKNYKNSDIGI